LPLFSAQFGGAEGEREGKTSEVRVLGGEPLVHYGPFVMNSIDEINQAVEDFNTGKFGELAD
jgi:quercetin 2,3-dioxygenase